MSDNPMYWQPGQHPRAAAAAAWHQQQSAPSAAPPTQPVNSMTDYATHPGTMLPTNTNQSMANPMAGSGMVPQTQSSNESVLNGQLQSFIPPPPGSGQAPGGGRSTGTGNVGIPNSHQLQQQQQPPQTQVYQTMGAPGGMVPQSQTSNDPNLGARQPQSGILQHQQQSHYPQQYTPLANTYWNQPPPPPMQQQSASFHNPKDIPPPTSDHMMSAYDRRSTALSHSQQPNPVSNYSSSYYGQPTPGQSPYPPPRPPPVMNQKPQQPTASYYGYDSYFNQVPPSQANPDPYLSHRATSANSQHWPSSANSNQMISNTSAPPPPGIPNSGIHPLSPSGPTTSTLPTPSMSRQTPSSLTPNRNQAPQHSTFYQTSTMSRQTPTSITPNRSPAPQHNTFYPSPQQSAASSSSKSGSNSLAQLEQMVMPTGAPSSNQTSTKSPTHRSSTSSPSTNITYPQQQPPQQQQQQPQAQPPQQQPQPSTPQQQPQPQQLQYSYNSSGQGSYFSSNTAPGQSSYYPQYDPNSVEMQKSSAWGEPSSGQHMNSSFAPLPPHPPPSMMMDGGPSSYGPPSAYDGSNLYGEYTTLSAPSNSMNSQPRFPPTTSDKPDTHSTDKSDPYAIDSQTFDDYDDQSMPSKAKKGRAKKGEEKVKKERKPRAPRAPKKDAQVAPMPVESPAPATPATPTQTQALQPQIPSPAAQIPTELPPQEDAPIDPQASQTISESNQLDASKDKRIKTPDNKVAKKPPKSGKIKQPGDADNSALEHSSSPSPDQEESQPEPVNELPLTTMTQQSTPNPPPDKSPVAQFDTNNADIQKTPNWTEVTVNQQMTSTSYPPPPSQGSSMPAMMEGAPQPPGPYYPPNYDNNNLYGQYTPLSGPSSSITPQPSYPAMPVPSESHLIDKSDNFVGEQPSAEVPEDSILSSKPKKARSKKGDDKTKKERRPRAPRAPKKDVAIPVPASSQNSNSSLPQLPSPASSQLATDITTQDTSIDPQAISTTSEPTSSETKPKRIRSRDPASKRAPKSNKPKKGKLPGEPENDQSDIDNTVLHSPTGESTSDPTLLPSTLTGEANSSQPIEEPTIESKPKRIRIRDSNSKSKKKLPKFALKFAKTKKRKRLGSSDNDQSDLDKTPPPSPDEVESGVQKRRSARNTKKLKYNDDIELGFSDSDDSSQMLPKTKKATPANVPAEGADSTMLEETAVADEPTVFAAPVEDTMVVEKIMSSRMGQRELEPEPGEVLPPDGTHIEVEEFYVKYKNLSHLHCDWRTLEELEKGDRRVIQKVKRYKQKKDSSNLFSFMDEEPFDPQYCEVDRILALNEVEEMVPDSSDEIEKAPKPLADIELPKQPKAIEGAPEVSQPESVVPMEVDVSVTITDTEKTSDGVKLDPPTEAMIDVPMKTETVQDDLKSEPEKESNEIQIPKSPSEPKLPGGEDSHVAKSDASVDGAKNLDVNAQSETHTAEPAKDVEVTEKLDGDQLTTEPVESTPIVEEQKVERVQKMKKKVSRHFLVKWRGLSYEESTWELEDDLDPEKIKQFMRFKDPPPKSKWKPVKRPKPEEWVRKEASPIYKNNNTLREYQLEGINWLSFCWHQGRNCILADEMGLGKTIQSIAFVNEIYQHGINGPFLIIVPLSTVGNWAREFETWTDLNVITYHGSSTSREMLKEYEMFYRNEQGNRITSYYKFQVMITTFEIILSDCLDLREIPWKCCIIDEAHRLKNRNCKLLEGLRLLNMEHRVLLTGTPLQNNVEELFSLLNFLEPNQFSSTEQFLQEFGDLKTEAQVDKLKLILKPMMLRRLKEDVEKTLAPKEETIVEVELTNIQKKYYRAILEKNFSFLTKGSSNNNMPNLMNTMMELRKCCIHPYLINGAEEQIIYEARQAKLAGGEPMSSFQAMVNSSGKLVLIDKLLPRLRADGHRVLIFSQMVRCLDILEDYVTHKHYPFERIDGRVRGSERQQAIDRFSKPGSDRFVFLLCTRAGGLGINLTAADTVIIFDSDWNPQNDLQAQARCHRIGQSKAVKIYRLICRNTYEREMFDKASLKLGLDKAVLQSMNTQKGGAGGMDGQLTKKEIEELLRKGAYGALMDDDNAGDKFCEEDIDQILQRRTQVITIDNSEAKGSTFSKATFSSSNNREDIELDDPNFWEKWAKKANIDSDELLTKDELIQLAPRRRTQTKRYGADGNLIDISDLESSEEDEETISMRTRGSRSGRQTKSTPSSSFKRNKRRLMELDDDEFLASLNAGYWSRGDCLKVEKGLLIHGWGRWQEIIASNKYKREMKPEDVEAICRVILLYCLHNYKGDEKIKSFAWELITPPEETNKAQAELESNITTRGRKPKVAPVVTKKTTAEEMIDAEWPKEPKNDPLIVLPDDQYRRHLQRNCNRVLIRIKFLHYLKNDILKGYDDKILADCNISEVDLPSVPVDGELPAPWWDDDADKSLLVGIFKHGHDKFNLMRQDSNLCFLHKCGPPNKEDLLAEMNHNDKMAEDMEDENRDTSMFTLNLRDVTKFNKSLEKDSIFRKDSDAGEFLENLVENVAKDLSVNGKMKQDSNDIVDENKNSILKCNESQDISDTFENGINELQTTKMDITDDDESTTNEANDNSLSKKTNNLVVAENGFFSFPSANDLNQRFRRLITAYQRNFKKLEIKLAQKARDELKKERTSKYEAAKNEREERKKFLAQKWSRREEGDFFRAISSFGVEYDAKSKRHDWNRFRAMGKLEKKLDETMEEYYKAFVIMCKKVTNKPITPDEEKCPINVEAITEERASKCLARIEFLNKLRNEIIVHPELDERLKQCLPQSDIPDWWENGKHDKELLFAAAKHGLTRLDYNIAHDSTLSFDSLIKLKAEQTLTQPPTPILMPVEQLEDLLMRNGVDYVKDSDLQDDTEDVKAVINCLLDSIEEDGGYKSFTELIDGPHSKTNESLLSGSTNNTKTPPKATRSSTANSQRPSQGVQSKRGANTIVRSTETKGSGTCVRLTTIGHSALNDSRFVEITPILPDKIPEDATRSFEAGEISITFQSDAALLQLDDREPIVLVGAMNPISAKIRWPKDKAIQTRLENLVSLIEKNEWPNPPRPSVPTITLPANASGNASTNALSVSTTSPTKNDKSEMSLGSPKSDISNISSKASKQDLKETHEAPTPRGRRGRGRKPRQADIEIPANQEIDTAREDRQSKFRNLSNQASSSSTRDQSSSGSNINNVATKLTNAKFGANKQGNLSSLLASFKQQKRTDASSSTRPREDKNLLDFNASTNNLLPQILANMKPEFRDLLSNQDAATMLLNSLGGLTGSSNLSASLLSNPTSQMALESLLNVPSSSSSKGPPPAHHQLGENLTSAHNDNTRELRRSSQANRDNKSPPSINLRSTRGRGNSSMASLDQKVSELAHAKGTSSNSKKRGRPSANTTEQPSAAIGGDVLDLSSLQFANKPPTSLRSRRHRDQSEDLPTSPPRSTASVAPKDDRQAPAKLRNLLSQGPSSSKGMSCSGSGIDSVAAKLTAKLGANKPGSLSSLLASSKEKKTEAPVPRPRDDKILPDLNSTATANLLPQILANMKPEFRDLLSNQDAATMLLNSLGGLTGTGGLGSGLLTNPSSQLSIESLLNVPKTSSSKGPPPAHHQLGENLTPVHGDNTRELRRNSQSKSSPSVNLRSTRGRGSSLEVPQKSTELSGHSSSKLPISGNSKKRASQPTSSDPPPAVTIPGADVLDLSSLQFANKAASSLRSDTRSRRHREQTDELLANAAASLSSVANSKPSGSAASIPTSAPSLNLGNQFPNLNNLGGLLNFPGMSDLMKSMSTNFPGLGGTLPRIPTTATPTTSETSNRRSRQSNLTTSSAQTPTVSNQQQQANAANAALANSLMSLVTQQPGATSNPYGNFANPFANPLLPFGLGNLGMNNPLGMGALFPNMYGLPGFPVPEPNNQTNNSTDKDKKMRRK